MSLTPFDVSLVIDRLQAAVGKNALRLVSGSADYASVDKLSDFAPPCAFVLLARERGIETASGSSLPGQQRRLPQRMEVTFGVVLAVRHYRQTRGHALRDELGAQLARVRGLLLGWTPPLPGARACQLLQGDLTDYDHSTALWIDVWRTQHVIQPENTP